MLNKYETLKRYIENRAIGMMIFLFVAGGVSCLVAEKIQEWLRVDKDSNIENISYMIIFSFVWLIIGLIFEKKIESYMKICAYIIGMSTMIAFVLGEDTIVGMSLARVCALLGAMYVNYEFAVFLKKDYVLFERQLKKQQEFTNKIKKYIKENMIKIFLKTKKETPND